MKERKPLAVGDRVRVYGWVQMHHTPYQPRAGGDATVKWVSNGHTHVIFDRMPNGAGGDGTCYSVHPKQCRRLVRKPKERVWTAQAIKAAFAIAYGTPNSWREMAKALGIES